jgi:hypothetical protein
VTDLTPLKDLLLETLVFSPEGITNGIDTVRSMKTLKECNGGPAVEFWRRYDAGEFRKK